MLADSHQDSMTVASFRLQIVLVVKTISFQVLTCDNITALSSSEGEVIIIVFHQGLNNTWVVWTGLSST